MPLSPQMTEKLQDMENEAMSKIVELEKQLMQRNKELESIRVRLPLGALTFVLSFIQALNTNRKWIFMQPCMLFCKSS